MPSSPTVRLEMGVDILQDLGVSTDGSIQIFTTLNSRGEELASDEGVELSELLDEMHSDLRADGEYQLLYVAAHELRRLSEEIYETARNIESSDETVMGRYNITPEVNDLSEGFPE